MNQIEYNNKIERKALLMGAIINLIMAFLGWVAYYLSNSHAMMLDANLSLVVFITALLAIRIVEKKHKISSLFPYGKHFLESLFVLSRGVILLGITITAFVNSLFIIIDYSQGKELNKINSIPILIYTVLMVVLCFGLAFYYSKINTQISKASSILSIESKSSLIDGYVSLVLGTSLVLSTLIPESSNLSFMLYIGDSVFVLILCVFLLKIPYEIIKESLIELGGGVIQDKTTKLNMESDINQLLPESLFNYDTYITKLGSSYYVGIKYFPHLDLLEIQKILELRDKLNLQLSEKYNIIDIEIIIGKFNKQFNKIDNETRLKKTRENFE